MKIIIPMAGDGSRFSKAGYTFPKPLIDVAGQPMIERVVNSLTVEGDVSFVFIVRQECLDNYPGVRDLLSTISNNRYDIVAVDKLTDGAACTVLLAEELINVDEDILVVNSDQIVKFSSLNFESLKRLTDADGIIFTFSANHPKWSFVRMSENNTITEVVEKQPISSTATVGIYWFRNGKNLVNSLYSMISKNRRFNNEFYFAPVYNEMIEKNQIIIPFEVDEMHGVGTPEDLNDYLRQLS